MFEEKSLFIGNKTVQKYVGIDDAIDIVQKTWEWFGDDKIIMPSKITTDMSSAGVNGWFNSMPCYIHPLDIAMYDPFNPKIEREDLANIIGCENTDI